MAVGRVFPNEVDRIFNAPGGPIGKEARKVAMDTAAIARLLSGRLLGRNPMDAPRTGDFERGWRVTVLGRSTEFQVSNRVPYAAAIEKGAGPHPINARRVTYLRFRDRSGQWRKIKTVRHPGNQAYRILETAAIMAMRQRYGSAAIR